MKNKPGNNLFYTSPQGAAAPSEQPLSEGQLAQRIGQQKTAIKKSRKYKIIAVVWFVAAITCLPLADAMDRVGLLFLGGILFFVGAFTFLKGYTQKSTAQKNIKQDVGNTLVRAALEEVFENVHYQVDGHIPEDTVRQVKRLVPWWNEIKGSDYVRASYKGLGIEMSDLHLVQVTSEMEDGKKKEQRITVFQGLWLVCDFGRALSADLTLEEKPKGRFAKKLSGVSDIEVDNAAFNEMFIIKSENPHEIFYILTPHMMEYILRADKLGEGKTYMMFSRDGKVHIAIHSGRDAFEIGKNTDLTDFSGMRERFLAEIRYVTNIIDELRLVDTLFAT